MCRMCASYQDVAKDFVVQRAYIPFCSKVQVHPASPSSTKPPSDFTQACLLAAPLDFRTLDVPVIHSRTSEHGSFHRLPLKPATHSTSLKSVVELVEPMSAGDSDFGHLYHLISTAKYEDLPGPLSVNFANGMNFKMQLLGPCLFGDGHQVASVALALRQWRQCFL